MNIEANSSWQGQVTDDQPQKGELFDRVEGIQQNHHKACDVLKDMRLLKNHKTNELMHPKTPGMIIDTDSYCAYWKEKIQKLHANEEELPEPIYILIRQRRHKDAIKMPKTPR